MKPDKELADTLANKRTQEEEERKKMLGPEGLKKCEDKLKRCQDENTRPLPDNLKRSFPPIPPHTSIPRLPVSIQVNTIFFVITST